MRIRAAITAITAALVITLVGCSSNDKADDAKSRTSAPAPSVDTSAAEEAAGIPPKPDAAIRTVILDVLKAINPSIVTDDDKTIDDARNQCSTINSGGNADQTAKARFSTPDHKVTDAEAQAINAALKVSICAT
ncbi:hypothetical protein [Streptomyces sp. NPDC002491]